MLSYNFRTGGLRSIPTFPMMVLTEFFHADTETNVHLLPVAWYFISNSLWWDLYSCMHTMSIIWSAADAVSSCNWPILFKILLLNVAMWTVSLRLCNFGLNLSFGCLANYLNIRARSLNSIESAKWFGHMVWIWVMVIFRLLFFYLITWHHSYRWVAVISWLNYLSLVVYLWSSSTKHHERLVVDLTLNSSAFASTILLPMAFSNICLENNFFLISLLGFKLVKVPVFTNSKN